MKLSIEINTDGCSNADAVRINQIVTEALQNVMDTVAVEMDILSKKTYSVGEQFLIKFNVGCCE